MKRAAIIIMILTTVLLLVAQNMKYAVDSKICIGCQICISKCPVKAIEMKDGKAVIDLSKCIGCGLCATACPVKAISQVKPQIKTEAKPETVKKETEVLSSNKVQNLNKETTPKTPDVINTTPPPTETIKSQAIKTVKKVVYNVKNSACIGCKICISECPVKAIKYSSLSVVIDVTKCIGCGLCAKKCPTSAISKVEITKD